MKQSNIKDFIIIGLATLIGFVAGAGLTYNYFKNKMKENQGYHFNATPQDPSTAGSAFEQNVTDPSQQPDFNAKTTSILFTENSFDFGKINEGDVVNTFFEFTNNGAQDLVIKNCTGSCGCTVADWPKEPIKPGMKGKIKVQFSSAGKRYKQKKTVTVVANTDPSNQLLYIYADITPAK
jgi:hypothetical protein